MSKNTSSNAFRKIDVDQFNEDNFRDEDGPTIDNNQVGGVTENEIANLLQKSKAGEALKMLLASAPVGNKSQKDKVSINSLANKSIKFRK